LEIISIIRDGLRKRGYGHVVERDNKFIGVQALQGFLALIVNSNYPGQLFYSLGQLIVDTVNLIQDYSFG
jgi:hypothetical protein